MSNQPLCFFSIVRYVADPIRDEPKNIGALVVCPERRFGGARFLLSRSGIAPSSSRYDMLQDLIRSYQIDLPGYNQLSLFAPVPFKWTRVELEELHRECTNLIQFTEPAAALAEPSRLLDELYHERIQTRESSTRTNFSRGIAARVFRRAFHRYDRIDWVQEDTRVQVKSDTYHFDLGIGNGQLYYVIETLSFRNVDLQRVEQAGGWYAYVWPKVAQETGAKSLLLVEPPKDIGGAQDRFRRVTDWASEVGITVHDANETNQVAEKIADELLQKTSYLHQ